MRLIKGWCSWMKFGETLQGLQVQSETVILHVGIAKIRNSSLEGPVTPTNPLLSQLVAGAAE